MKKTLRVCPKGHRYYKSSECPVCPTCEGSRKPENSFLSLLSAPARRALENEGVSTLSKLSSYTVEEILQLHGVGKSSIPRLKEALSEVSLSFKTEGPIISPVEDYILKFPTEIRQLLQTIRMAIRKAAPLAEEHISYGMPAYKWNGPLVYFAGYKKHIGFYPTNTGIKAFQKDLQKYKTSKGAVQFPVDKNLPVALITRIVKFRLKENAQRSGK